jgi:hypothetical protein
VSCDEGYQLRSRQCLSLFKCKSNMLESRKCFKQNCRVPYFSEWSEWSNCTDPGEGCNSSYKFRSRQCINNDKGSCFGENVEYSICVEVELDCVSRKYNQKKDNNIIENKSFFQKIIYTLIGDKSKKNVDYSKSKY